MFVQYLHSSQCQLCFSQNNHRHPSLLYIIESELQVSSSYSSFHFKSFLSQWFYFLSLSLCELLSFLQPLNRNYPLFLISAEECFEESSFSPVESASVVSFSVSEELLPLVESISPKQSHALSDSAVLAVYLVAGMLSAFTDAQLSLFILKNH